MKRIALFGLLASFSLSSIAMDLGSKVKIESMSHKNRIEVLQKADACINAATTQAEYEKCESIEKQRTRR